MSDSDSDLAVSVYDPEDNLNFYGSPVERDDLSDCEVEESASTAQARNVAAAAAATTSNENIDTERTQVSAYLYFVPMLSYAFLLISTSATFISQFCSCKNTCGRRSGRKKRGCPCRDENLHCCDKCSCGTKKLCCKNKEQGTLTKTNANAGKNAFERHQVEVEVAKREITVSSHFSCAPNK